MKVAYSTGFWCTNIGNAFFSLGVEHVLKKVLGSDSVTLVSDFQTYTNAVGKRLYPHRNQLEYLSNLDTDCLILAGPVLSKYFLRLWRDILIKLHARDVRFAILSAGMMKMNDTAREECKAFFEKYPPYVLCTRDIETFSTFGKYADNAYDGICFSFFAPEYYQPCQIVEQEPFWVLNFDKMREPRIYDEHEFADGLDGVKFLYNDEEFMARHSKFVDSICKRTDRYTDALVYVLSMLLMVNRRNAIAGYSMIRTDNRFHPHYRNKIYSQQNSFCADVPYGYLNLYANSSLTLSDRVHSCAVTMAYGHPAMLFSSTSRIGLLDRVGATNITSGPASIDLDVLVKERDKMTEWLRDCFWNDPR